VNEIHRQDAELGQRRHTSKASTPRRRKENTEIAEVSCCCRVLRITRIAAPNRARGGTPRLTREEQRNAPTKTASQRSGAEHKIFFATSENSFSSWR